MSRPGLGLKQATRKRPTLGVERHAAIAAVDVASLPDSFSQEQHATECFNQNKTETCFAAAAAGCVYMACSIAGKTIFVPSPLVISQGVRALARAQSTPVGTPLPTPLADNGADDVTTFEWLAQGGVCPMLTQVPEGYYDANPGNVTTEPNFANIEASAKKLIVGPYAINMQQAASALVDACRACIFAGYPVWVSAWCGNAEFNWTPGNGPLGVPDQSAGGGHATYLSGWEKVNGVYSLLKRGSWGSGYGINGDCLVGSAWLGAAWSLWPVVVEAV